MLDEIKQLADIGRHKEAYDKVKYLLFDSMDAFLYTCTKIDCYGSLDQGLSVLDLALKLDPDNYLALSNKAYILQRINRLEEAYECSTRSLDICKDMPELYLNHGFVLHAMGKHEEAIKCFRHVLSSLPDNAQAHHNLGFSLLALEKFKEGWEEHEYRLIADDNNANFIKRYSQPHWNGENLENKTILVYNEQGLGDFIQFVRFLPMLKAKKCKIIVEIQQDLSDLAHDFEGVDYVIPRPNDIRLLPQLPPHDYVISINSLPAKFGLDGIFYKPYLNLSSKSTIDWSKYDSKLKIGIVWAGNYLHTKDSIRSMRLAEFDVLMDLPNTIFISLQKGDMKRSFEGKTIDLEADHQIKISRPELKNFRRTAEIISHLDLVIGVDTAITHIAGAMNKPVFVLVPTISDWRWGEDKKYSSWYPKTRIFKQQKLGDWSTVMKDVRAELEKYI